MGDSGDKRINPKISNLPQISSALPSNSTVPPSKNLHYLHFYRSPAPTHLGERGSKIPSVRIKLLVRLIKVFGPFHQDLVQIMVLLEELMSSDRFKSVEHRVLAKKVGSRISVACFFLTRHCPSSRPYGPIKELISDDNPPIYKDVLVSDDTTYYLSKELDGRFAMDNFKL